MRATSAALRAIGPTESFCTLTGVMPRMEMRPWVGRSPVTPVIEAGKRTEPPVSVPSAPTHMSAATAAPEPPLEPPAICAGFHGLRHCPNTGLSETMPQASSCMLALPMITAPCARKRSTTGAFSLGIWSVRYLAPLVVRIPAVSILSLSATGMPCSRPSQRPSACAWSQASAISRASPSVTVMSALSVPLSRRILSRQASTAWTALSFISLYSLAGRLGREAVGA